MADAVRTAPPPGQALYPPYLTPHNPDRECRPSFHLLDEETSFPSHS